MGKLKLMSFKGCHGCDLSVNRRPCTGRARIPVEVTFLKDQYELHQGINKWIFGKGETIVGKAIINNGKIYCIKAYSSKQPDLGEIYISLKYIRVHVERLGIVSHAPGMRA